MKKNVCTAGFLLLHILTSAKELQTIDRVYESNVKSVFLYPYNDDLKDVLQPAVQIVNAPYPMALSFDILTKQPENLSVRIYNCNYDWTLNNLNAIMYLDDYNDFQITDYTLSFYGKVPYVHYHFILPKIKISGNFIVIVFRNNNEEDLLLSRRLIVYEPGVDIYHDMKFPVSVNRRNDGQQADFTLSYNRYNVINPAERLKVVIRQNHNWNATISGLYPSFVRETARNLEYIYFNNENVFDGLNEFRFFDLRSLQAKGMNVLDIKIHNEGNEVLLAYDLSRGREPFVTSFDINGKYVPQKYESLNYTTEPDYCNVTFTLDTKGPVNGRVFVYGALSDWQLDQTFEMKYNAETKMYTCTVLLKQGYYNYAYAFLPQGTNRVDYTYFEGSHSITENVYEFIVYYRAPGDFFDRIIGYAVKDYMKR
ncbi:MAG: DUF5103 domain-containing protein [Cytophagaceae bacterium]|nr:DUF5103 domain-containing protein [Cytophagaceae bacterium]MDW8455910.1 DUF5103 domain-containing protein [Cytophagaceae bacterium]